MRVRRCLMLAALILSNTATASEIFSLKPVNDSGGPRNLYFPPLVSLVLPGFGQWHEQQLAAGAIYTTGAIGGLGLSATAGRSNHTHSSGEIEDYRGPDRQRIYGLQLYQLSGELSAFHNFRTAVESRRELYQFEFLTKNETTADLLTAPFDLELLFRPTTFIPLMALASLAASGPHSSSRFTTEDAAFTGGIAYNAGVGEEALFRGYLMPMLRQSTRSDIWSNAISASLFGAAHYSSRNRFPIVQGLLGFYFGWLTQRDGWSLRQAVFLHTWWDVLALGFAIAEHDPKATLWLPELSFTF